MARQIGDARQHDRQVLDGPAARAGDLRVVGIALPEELLAEPDQHRLVSRQGQLHLLLTQRDAALASPPLHDFGESGYLGAPLDRLDVDAEVGGNVLMRAMHRAEIFQFYEIDLDGWLAGVRAAELVGFGWLLGHGW